MRRRVLTACCLLVAPIGCLQAGCVSEGAGWRLDVKTAGFTIEYANVANEKGERKFRQSFDQEGWSVIGPWLLPDEPVGPEPEVTVAAVE